MIDVLATAEPAWPSPQRVFKRLLQAGFLLISRLTERRTGRGGPSEPPPEESGQDSIWNDPSLWMLMIH